MAIVRQEFKKETDTLDGFHKAWNKPLNEIIDDFYQHKTNNFGLLHTRVRNASDTDFDIINDILIKLSEKKEEELEIEDECLLKVLQKHMIDRKINHHLDQQSRWLQKNIIQICIKLYNGDTDLNAYQVELTEKGFYRQAFLASAVDPFGIHLTTDWATINDHFVGNAAREFVSSQANFQYLIGLQKELGEFLFSESDNGIRFPPIEGKPLNYDYISDTIKPNDYVGALNHYRNAISLGSVVALTGLARLYALGLAGLERDSEFAIQLYQLALQHDVLGALPCDSGDPRILFYSTLASGMCNQRRGAPSHSSLIGMRYIEADWLMKMNVADVKLTATLDKFYLLALKNPNNLFDELLDQDQRYLERLQFCLDEKTYQMVVDRKKNYFSDRLAVITKQTSFPPPISKLIFSFMSANRTCYKDLQPTHDSKNDDVAVLKKS